MNILKKILFYFGLGTTLSLFIIGLIHFYSLIFETYFSYAAWNNIMITALRSGVRFGIAIWVFKNLMTTQSIRENQCLYFTNGIGPFSSGGDLIPF
jgi:hypothetical protein